MRWPDDYRKWKHAYVSEAIDRFEAEARLRALGYRSEALRIELLEWTKQRDEYRNRHV